MDKRELTFRQVTSKQFQDSHPYGIEINTNDGTPVTSFWYDTTEKRNKKYWALGNMNDEFLHLFDILLNP